jgi:hypothetical protein
LIAQEVEKNTCHESFELGADGVSNRSVQAYMIKSDSELSEAIKKALQNREEGVASQRDAELEAKILYLEAKDVALSGVCIGSGRVLEAENAAMKKWACCDAANQGR